MESRHFYVFSFLLAWSSQSDAFLRGMRPPNYWGAVKQSLEAMQAKSPVGPLKEPSSVFKGTSGFHSKRIQPAGDQPQWKFPEGPVTRVSKRPVQFKVQQPQPSNPVAVRCGESKIHVEVSQDLLGIGKLIAPDEITLGGCPAAGVDHLSHVLIFESELHDCGSTLEV